LPATHWVLPGVQSPSHCADGAPLSAPLSTHVPGEQGTGELHVRLCAHVCTASPAHWVAPGVQPPVAPSVPASEPGAPVPLPVLPPLQEIVPSVTTPTARAHETKR
jgi:hypothetical protein